jgi:hypothetical protein
LHIRHPSLDPQDISRELQLMPEASFGAGEPRAPGGVSAGVHAQTYWAAQIDATLWHKSNYLRTFDPFAASVPMGELPPDRQARFELLVQRGRSQGYLTHGELREHLSGELDDGQALDRVLRTLGELGIPVHEPSSPALAAIRRQRGYDPGPLRGYLERVPALVVIDVLNLVCLRLASRHAAFLGRVRAEGGTVRLLVTLSSKAVHGLTLTPELSARLAQLGVTLELALADDSPRRQQTTTS